MEKTVTIEGMKCDGCVNIVKEKFTAIPGVEEVAVNLEGKSATIKSQQEISDHALTEALSDTKFTLA